MKTLEKHFKNLEKGKKTIKRKPKNPNLKNLTRKQLIKGKT